MGKDESYKDITKVFKDPFDENKKNINTIIKITKNEAENGTEKIIQIEQKAYTKQEVATETIFGEINIPNYTNISINKTIRELKVVISKGIKNNEVFVLKEEGNIVDGNKGDLYIHIKIYKK